MTRFSLIVPVYNAQDYLDDTLRTIACQDFSDFEVLCIDDGSTDESASLLARWQDQDARFCVVKQDNAGPSAARNVGLAQARGDYCLFVDADDSLAHDALSVMNAALEDDVYDALVFGWTCFPESKATRYYVEHAEVRAACYDAFCEAFAFDEKTLPHLRAAFKVAALRDAGVSFDESLHVGEDAQFLMAAYPRIGALRLIPNKLYRYRLPHEGSLMQQADSDTVAKLFDDLNMAISVFADWKMGHLLDKHANILLRWFCREVLYTCLRQSDPVRSQALVLIKDLLTATFDLDFLESCISDKRAGLLLVPVMQSSATGELSMSQRKLDSLLLLWRIGEYGIADLAKTILGR